MKKSLLKFQRCFYDMDGKKCRSAEQLQAKQCNKKKAYRKLFGRFADNPENELLEVEEWVLQKVSSVHSTNAVNLAESPTIVHQWLSN